MSDTPILETKELQKHFDTSSNLVDRLFGSPNMVKAVDGVSLSLDENEVQGVIGESGCGKTTLLMVLMGLYEKTGGDILYHGNSTEEFSRKDWKQFRRNVQIIFQDPFDSLDPKMTVRESLKEPLKIHNIENQDSRVEQVLENVELNPPEKYLDQYPDKLSGGEKQRVSIARALILEPDVILADEPVSMLDVSTQASILQLLSRLINEYQTSMIYISHDLSTVSYVCDVINVMYLGRIVERCSIEKLVSNPKHPYTQALINAIPIPDPDHNRQRTELKGSTPEPMNLGEGCRFKDRCPERMDVCEKTPAFVESDSDHYVACHLYYDHEDYNSQKNDQKYQATTDASTPPASEKQGE